MLGVRTFENESENKTPWLDGGPLFVPVKVLKSNLNIYIIFKPAPKNNTIYEV